MRVAKQDCLVKVGDISLYIAKIVRVAKLIRVLPTYGKRLYIAKIVRVAKLKFFTIFKYYLSLHSKNCEGSKTKQYCKM